MSSATTVQLAMTASNARLTRRYHDAWIAPCKTRLPRTQRRALARPPDSGGRRAGPAIPTTCFRAMHRHHMTEHSAQQTGKRRGRQPNLYQDVGKEWALISRVLHPNAEWRDCERVVEFGCRRNGVHGDAQAAHRSHPASNRLPAARSKRRLREHRWYRRGCGSRSERLRTQIDALLDEIRSA